MDSTAFLYSVQGLGLFAMGLDVWATLRKDDDGLRKIHGIASLLFSVHYFFLGAIPGALSELLNGTRTGLSAYTQARGLAFLFLLIYTVCLFVIPESIVTALPFIAGFSVTAGLYFYEGVRMRLFYLAAWIMWLVYSLSVISIGGIVLFSIVTITTSMTIFRLLRDQK